MTDITVVLTMAAVVLYICIKLKIPAIVAFLLAGMLAGPSGFRLVTDMHQVEVLAEVGVLLLLFTIGIEFSLEKLISSRRYVIVGGTLQMLLTIVAFFGIGMAMGISWNQSLFIGFLFSLSSTAIVLQLFQESNQIESLYGKVALSVLIFQDIAIVPLILILPWIAGKEFVIYDLLKLLGGLVIVTVVLIGSRKVMPKLISQVVHTRNRDLFLLFIIVVCFITALLTYQTGLSLALGAFLAGLMISESEFSYKALSSVLPLKKIFTSIFFISVGMLLDLNVLVDHPVKVLVYALAVMVVKVAIVLLVGLILRLPYRSVWITALALCQVGEFAFILSQQGANFSLLDDQLSQLFLSVSVISMGLSPFIIQYAPKIAARLVRNSFSDSMQGFSENSDSRHAVNMKDHVVIIGYGMNGRNVARAAREANIPHVIVDFNPETYRKEKLRRENFIYGDATNHDTLLRANVPDARIVVVATHDPIATEMIVSAVRKLSPVVRIIVRTRFMHEIDELRKLGANEVIPEEFETSIEIFTRVLRYYLVPEEEIDAFVNQIRNENYEMLRRRATGRFDHVMPFLSVMEVVTLRVPADSPWVGRTIGELKLRNIYGITILAIKRGRRYIHHPDANDVVKAEDVLVVIGLPEDIKKIGPFIQSLPDKNSV